MNPFVSVVITTYNQQSFIEATIESVLAQTYPNREIVVVDDGSTDGTPSRMAAYGDRIVSIRQKNQGVAESRNTGVRHARGELLAFLDGDDIWEPEKLAVQVDMYRRFPHAGLFVVDARQFSGSEVIDPATLRWAAEDFIRPQPRNTFCLSSYRALLPHNFIMTTSQVMIPAAVLRRIGRSDPALRIASDYDLYLRIAKHYEVAFTTRVLTNWRYVPTSASGPAALRPFRCRVDELRALRKQLKGATPEVRALIREIMRTKSWLTAREAYYYGWQTDRRFSRRFLPELWSGNRRSPWPLFYWSALLFPPRSQEAIKAIARAAYPRRRRPFPEEA